MDTVNVKMWKECELSNEINLGYLQFNNLTAGGKSHNLSEFNFIIYKMEMFLFSLQYSWKD